MTVPDKQAMYALYERGQFGNRLKTWKDVESLLESGYSSPVVLRYAGKGGQWCEYGVKPENVLETVSKWECEGADRGRVKYSELADDSRLIVQGEVQRSTDFLDLRYSREPLPMRKALARSQSHISGLAALTMLRAYIDPSSLDDLWSLFDRFPDSVIEFSVWGMDVGDCRGRNTVFWEIRNY